MPKEQLAQLEIKEDKKKNEPEQFQALQPDKLPEIKEFSFAEQAPHIEIRYLQKKIPPLRKKKNPYRRIIMTKYFDYISRECPVWILQRNWDLV